jgi:hypothetical protein
MRKVAIVGSSSFEIDTPVGAEIVELIRDLGEDTVILTRGSKGVDEFVAAVCLVLGIKCLYYRSKGGPDNWTRDIELVTDADEVIALVERALDKGKRVRAFSVVDNRLVFAGELP